MTFVDLVNGSYSFTILQVPRYTVSTYGTFTIASSNVSESVLFSPIPQYDLNFVQSGLPAGGNWSVTLIPQSGPEMTESSTSNVITFSLYDQTSYNFFINNENGNFNGNNFGPNPEIGSAYINGANENVQVQFSNVGCNSNPAGCVDSTSLLNINEVLPGNRVTENSTLGAGGLVYDPADGDLYVANSKSATISVVNPVSMKIVATINTNNVGSATVVGYRIFPGWGSPVALAINPGTNTIYASTSSGGVIEIDPGTNQITTAIDLISFEPYFASNVCPGAIAYNPSSGLIYVDDACSQLVWTIEPSSNGVSYLNVGYYGACQHACDFYPSGIAYANGYVYVSGQHEYNSNGDLFYAGRIDVIDSSNSIFSVYDYQSEISSITFNPLDGYLYASTYQGYTPNTFPFSYYGTNGISIIDPTYGMIIQNITSIGTPQSVSFDPYNNFIYASLSPNPNAITSGGCANVCVDNFVVSVINSATKALIGNITVGGTGNLA